ncbi:MAG: sigma-70 family RNA polymerase sigma factor [Bacteroidetes bacterium]|nr:MAG: sigma-70 family RNA polymerase sigma factor [Bacteroidota bacterium]
MEKRGPYIVTIEQFWRRFLPKLLSHLIKEYQFKKREADLVGQNVLDRLESKFSGNNSQPVQVFHEALTIIVTRETNKFRRLMDKNFGLSETSFNDMILKMRQGDESIFEVVFLSHFDFCLNYLQGKYKASYENAYDATMNAMVAFCKGLKDESITYGNLKFLFTQMAGQYYFKWIRREKIQEPMPEIDIPEEQDDFEEASLNILDKAWDLLGEGCQKLLENFYYNNSTLIEIAKKHEKSPTAMRKQKQRCIEKLRGYFKQMNH